MIGFKNFITEARAAPLYHGTRATNFGMIWTSNMIKGGSQIFSTKAGVRNFVDGVSLTRSFDYAKFWALENIGGGYGKVVIKLNQDQLVRNYKLQPYNFWTHRDNHDPTKVKTRMSDSHKSALNKNEYEEWIKGDIKNIRKYITDIYISSAAREYFNSPVGIEEYNGNILDMVKKEGVRIHDLV